MAAAVAPTGLTALIAGSLSQLLGLLLQQLIQRFFHAAANQFFQLCMRSNDMNQKGEKFDLRDGKMNSPQTISHQEGNFS